MCNDHDTGSEAPFDSVAFSRATTKKLDNVFVAENDDDPPTQAIVRARVTDQDLLNHIESDRTSPTIDRVKYAFEMEEMARKAGESPADPLAVSEFDEGQKTAV
jgi:hypothetical protein